MEFWRIWYSRQPHQSEQLDQLLSYIQDTVQEGESRDFTRLKKMVVRYQDQKMREKHFFSRERQLKNPASGAAAAMGKSKGKGKRNSGYCVQWTTKKRQCSRGDKCVMKQDPEKKRDAQGKGKGFATVQLSKGEFLGLRNPAR